MNRNRDTPINICVLVLKYISLCVFEDVLLGRIATRKSPKGRIPYLWLFEKVKQIRNELIHQCIQRWALKDWIHVKSLMMLRAMCKFLQMGLKLFFLNLESIHTSQIGFGQKFLGKNWLKTWAYINWSLYHPKTKRSNLISINKFSGFNKLPWAISSDKWCILFSR